MRRLMTTTALMTIRTPTIRTPDDSYDHEFRGSG